MDSILRKSIRQAKKDYYASIFVTFKNDIKKTWQNIRQILNKSNRSKTTINEIIVGGNVVNDKETIVNSFNDFFVNIGPNLAEKIDIDNRTSYDSYLSKVITSAFHFMPIDGAELSKLLKASEPKHRVNGQVHAMEVGEDIASLNPPLLPA